eukprot:scaffold678842_cov62-Prasinocladus_malaysianus.AAC.1
MAKDNKNWPDCKTNQTSVVLERSNSKKIVSSSNYVDRTRFITAQSALSPSNSYYYDALAWLCSGKQMERAYYS